MPRKKITFVLWTLLIIVVVNTALSAYIGLQASNSDSAFCSIDEEGKATCDEVLNSEYASLLGVPLTHWGVAFFGMLSILLALLLLSNQNKRLNRLLKEYELALRWFLNACFIGGSAGAIYFLYLQFFVIDAICQYCQWIDWTMLVATVIYLTNLSKMPVVSEN